MFKLDRLKINQRSYYQLPNSAFKAEFLPQNPEFKNNPENFNPCVNANAIRTNTVEFL